MNRLTLLLCSGCIWAVMMYLLFEREIRPYFEYRQPPTYRQMLGERKTPEVQVRSIWFAQRQIGEAETLTRPLSAAGYRIETRLTMHMKDFIRTPLKDDRIRMASTVNVDAGYQLSSVDIDASLQGVGVMVDGRRSGTKLEVAYQLLVFRGKRTVDLPPDAMLSDSFLPYQGGTRLSVGKKWKMRVVDINNLLPGSGSEEKAFRDVYATVETREEVPNREGKEPMEAFKVDVRKEANDELPEYTLWVDDEGNVVQQETLINKLPCRIVLESRRDLTDEEAKAYPWKMGRPMGR